MSTINCSNLCRVRKVHVDVLRSNGKDKKRGIDQYKARPVKDMEGLLIRKDKLRKKLNQEMNQYKVSNLGADWLRLYLLTDITMV